MPSIDPNKLRNQRKRANLNQGELAARLGWSQPKLSQYENADTTERKQINGEALKQLTTLLCCEEKDLLVPEPTNTEVDTANIDRDLLKDSIKAINKAEKELGLHLTEDQKLNAAIHLYSEKTVSDKSALSLLKLFA